MFPTDDPRYDCSDSRYRDLYTGPHAADARPDDWFLDRWEGKLYEVVDGYRPDLIWFDFGLGFIREQRRKRFLAYYYNKEREWGQRRRGDLQGDSQGLVQPAADDRGGGPGTGQNVGVDQTTCG